MIISAVIDTVYQKIMGKERACDMQEALKRNFEAFNENFEASSKDALMSICWTTTNDVWTHIAKLISLQNELNNGLKAKNATVLPELISVCKILHMLPTNFEMFKLSWRSCLMMIIKH